MGYLRRATMVKTYEIDLSPPTTIHNLCWALRADGAESFVVGGWPRDRMLEIEDGVVYNSKDIDMVVFKMDFATLVQKIKRIIPGASVGNENHFPFVSFTDKESGLRVEITTPRIGESRKPCPGATILQDALRRDLTISSLYYSPITKRLIDVTGKALPDIRDGLMRPVSVEYFIMDPNRLALAFNKASRFNLKATQAMKDAAAKLQHKIKDIPKDVIGQTLKTWAYTEGTHGASLVYIQDCNLYNLIYGLAGTQGFKQHTPYHTETLWSHIMMCVNNMSSLLQNPGNSTRKPSVHGYMLLAALWHDCAKLETKVMTNGVASYKGHETMGADAIDRVITEYNMGNEIKNKVVELIAKHMILHTIGDGVADRTLVRIATNLKYTTMLDLADMSIVDKLSRSPMQASDIGMKVRELYYSGRFDKKPQRLLTGTHLINDFGLTPGKDFGVILNAAFDAQLDGIFHNLSGAKVWANSFINSFYTN